MKNAPRGHRIQLRIWQGSYEQRRPAISEILPAPFVAEGAEGTPGNHLPSPLVGEVGAF
jgi:hypothetical protein